MGDGTLSEDLGGGVGEGRKGESGSHVVGSSPGTHGPTGDGGSQDVMKTSESVVLEWEGRDRTGRAGGRVEEGERSRRGPFQGRPELGPGGRVHPRNVDGNREGWDVPRSWGSGVPPG